MKKTYLQKPALLVAMVLVLSATGFIRPALADDWRDGRPSVVIVHEHDEWLRHEREARRWHRHHPVYEPTVIYAPPPVCYAPPPPPSEGINLILPLHFR